MLEITYHKEGDYYIPDLYLEDYKKDEPVEIVVKPVKFSEDDTK